MIWKYTIFFTLALLTACAEIPPSSVASIPGAPPQRIGVELGSQVEHKPYSPNELANPAVQSLIAQCEQPGGEHCLEDTVPANSRTKFVRTSDDKVCLFVSLGGLGRDRDYAVRLHLFEPEGKMRTDIDIIFHYRPGYIFRGSLK